MGEIEQWEIPNNWKWAQISELGTIVAGGTPSTKEPTYWGNDINWISPADLSGYNNKLISKGAKSLSKKGLEKSSAKLMPSGSIHFSSRAPIGYVVISKEEMSTNQGFKSLVPADGIFNEYVYYFLKSAKQLAENRASGTTFKELSGKAFSLLPIPIAPYNEQHRIVAKIELLFSDLDNGIANLKKAQEQLKIYRQAVLKKAFVGELTRKWREEQTDLPSAEELLQQIKEEREKHYQKQLDEWKKAVKEREDKGKAGKKPSRQKKPKELPPLREGELKELQELPEGWCWKKIGNICECIVPNRDKPKSFTGNVKWITTPDLQIDSIRRNYSNVEKGLSEMEIKKYNAKVIPLGSVIMTCVGKFGISSIVEKRIVVNQQLHAFLPVNFCYNKYLAYCIQYNKVFFEKRATSTTIQYLNKNNCNSMPFSFCSFQEQHQIVQEIETRLSVCDKMETTITESLQKSEALRQSILKKAFEGKLLSEKQLEEARNAPDWEPADKLLERIKTEKAKPGNKKSLSGTPSK